MRVNSSQNRQASQIEIEFTDKPITPFGGMALLMLVGCRGRPVALGERFTLWKGETVRVREAGLTLEIRAMAYQAPGSQTPGDGFVELRVMESGDEETTVTLLAGQEAEVGGYLIHLERLVVDVENEGCDLVVTR